MQLKNIITRAIVVGVLCFVILFIGAYKYTNFKRGQWEKDIRSDALEVLISKKSKLEKALYSRIYYTKGVASFVSLNPNISNYQFNILAQDLIKNDSVISSMALSPNCIISAIYPLLGHEAAIGLNLLSHPERVEIVDKTIETRKTFVAGPVELVEGGIAFISYTPVFDKTQNEAGIFWGVTDIVIKMDVLFEEVGLVTEEDNFEFALRGYNGSGLEGKLFYGREDVFKGDPETVIINLPYGSWILASKPIKGWESFYNQDQFLYISLIISSFVISVLIGLLFLVMLKIRANERKISAIFKSLDSLVIEFNQHGDYLSVATPQSSLLVKPVNEIIGKNVREIFEPDLANQFKNAIAGCLQTKELVTIEYPLLMEEGKKWFQGRISYKNDESVIFNAIDITHNKESEEIIMQSNQMKDQLFSILAHDLKNPMSAFMQVTHFLVDNFDRFDKDEIFDKLELMKDSSREVYNLLEDVLEWQMLQKKSAQIKFTAHPIKPLVDGVMEQLNALARVKNITLVNQCQQQLCGVINSKLFETVIRNIITNAIKFSNSDSTVFVSMDEVERKNSTYLKINVTDRGVGMNREQIKSILESQAVKSNHGTNQESGSGLGLVICKDFIEKMNGELLVESEPEKGSVFSVLLKKA